MGSALPLTRPRLLNGQLEQALPIRSNITDYGNPGWHLHPPVAFTRRSLPKPAQRGGLAQAIPFPPGELPADTIAAALAGLGPEPSAVAVCAGPGGSHTQLARGVPGTTTDVVTTVRFGRPGIIRYVEVMWNVFDATGDIRSRIKISEDNNTGGGENTSGVDLDEGQIGTADFIPTNTPSRSYPNKIVPLSSWFLKFVSINNTATARSVQYIVNIDWLI